MQSSLREVNRTLLEIILSVYEVFIPLSLESETKLKKEETVTGKIIIQTKLNFNDIK